MTDNREMVVVATVSQPMEATPIQVRLGTEGIDSHLDGDYTVAANPLLSNAIGGIQLLVSARDAERAAAVLAEYFKAKAESEAIVARTCPRCGKKNGIDVRRPALLAVLAVITFGAFCLLYPWPLYRCPDCKHKWR
ncbi:hypothetical protein ACFLS1_05610 [Verrucomicrobiota bacterium]